MNLWVKRTGQLLVAVLFLMSCEDDTYLLGFQNKNKKFNVRYQQFSLPSTVLLLDSTITDNNDGNSRFLVGQYQDLRFGTVRAETFTQIVPSSPTALGSTAVYDSVTIQVRLDFYSYGLTGESEERFTVHEITEDSLSLYNKRYYYNSTIGYDPTSLGEVSCLVNTDSLSKNANLQTPDTILFKGKLSDAIGMKLFNLALTEIDTLLFTYDDFLYAMKGLAFIPSQSNLVMGINSTSLSQVTLHYHTADEDSLTRLYRMGANYGSLAFNNITTSRTGDLAAITQTYEGYAPASGLRYLQNGTPVITKLDISEFYSFITGSADGINDSITNMEINTAEISCSIESPPDGMPPPSQLVVGLMNSDDHYMDLRNNVDSTFLSGFYVLTGAALEKNVIPYFYYYYPLNDLSRDWVTLDYDSESNKYIGYATLFFQNLFAKKETDRKNGVENPNQIQYLGLTPITPPTARTVNRAVINANSIKLKVTYTTPKVTNQ